MNQFVLDSLVTVFSDVLPSVLHRFSLLLTTDQKVGARVLVDAAIHTG